MTQLSTEKLEKFRDLLVGERTQLKRVFGRPEAEGQDQVDLVGDLSDYPDHPADLGTETFEREKDETLRDNAREMLEEVESALRKITDGTYGICSSCKKDIPEGRLEAKPAAVYCVPCQNALEGR